MERAAKYVVVGVASERVDSECSSLLAAEQEARDRARQSGLRYAVYTLRGTVTPRTEVTWEGA